MSNAGGVAARGTIPPSTTKPPCMKRPIPMPERAPRPSRTASARTSRGMPCRRRIAAATASASCVPEPRPAWEGTASSTCSAYAPASRSEFIMIARKCAERSRSGPVTLVSGAARSESRVPGASRARPMLPNCRPRPPFRSRKPRCSLPVQATSTPLAAMFGIAFSMRHVPRWMERWQRPADARKPRT